MGILTLSVVASVLMASALPTAFAQDSKKEPSGSITGRVMIGGKPAPRITVILSRTDRQMQQSSARATTDEDGRFTLKAVPAGSYTVVPFSPALVVGADTFSGQPGKTVSLSEGEEVDGIDFSLIKGGVITGRVTDADGRILIEQRINIIRIDERGQRLPTPYFNPFMFTTDDRGVYRIYGLSPGRYKVSAGDAPDSGAIRVGFGGGSYPRTFHPDVAEEAKASVVEVNPDTETPGIDIKLGRGSRTFVATGRIIDVDTGKPVANIQYGHGPVTKENRMGGGFGWTSNRTNNNGEFRIEGLSNGRYAAFAVATEQVDFYSEPAVFEISDTDVNAIEIKTRRGSTISGVAIVEGVDDPDVLARLQKLEFRANIQTEGLTAPAIAPIRLNPDGGFLITGLRPGKVRISLGTFGYEPARGFSLIRIEREGVVLRDGMDVSVGENVSGVRLVIGYGTGVVRGQVRVQGGELAANTRLRISARRLDGEAQPAGTTVDARGRFSLEALLPGEYEITVNQMVVTPSAPGGPSPPARQSNQTLAKQNASVTNGVETEVILVVNLADKDKENDK